MTKIESIQAAIEALSVDEFISLRNWIDERDWSRWDRQIEKDDANGKLDFLLEEAEQARRDGELKEL